MDARTAVGAWWQSLIVIPWHTICTSSLSASPAHAKKRAERATRANNNRTRARRGAGRARRGRTGALIPPSRRPLFRGRDLSISRSLDRTIPTRAAADARRRARAAPPRTKDRSFADDRSQRGGDSTKRRTEETDRRDGQKRQTEETDRREDATTTTRARVRGLLAEGEVRHEARHGRVHRDRAARVVEDRVDARERRLAQREAVVDLERERDRERERERERETRETRGWHIRRD